MKTNYEIKFPINPISIDEIEKKKIFPNPQTMSTNQTCEQIYELYKV
jgi:hypothetical protein